MSIGMQHPMRIRRSLASMRRRCTGFIAFLFVVGYLFPLVSFYKRSLTETFLDTPRRGEGLISDEEFMNCVGERLANPSNHPGRIPFVILPVTMDYQDLKHFFCNVTAPMTYIMLINNGEFKPLRGLLDRLENRLTAYVNKTLFIIHHPENTGYASAVNEGLRYVLNYTVKQVPWVFITNADVRFGTTLVPEFVHAVNKRTRYQNQHIKRLEDEVAREVETAANAPDRRFTYRSNQLPVVTATSLPYRIRVMPPSEMKTQFNTTYGIFFPSSKPHMASFAVSRLSLATVGLFDENYYPAYGEDHDYMWRLEALGFLRYLSPQGRFIHFENANLNVNADVKTRGIAKYTAHTIQGLKFGRMNYQPFRLHYRRSKWFPGNPVLEAEVGRRPLPFNGDIPVDMWVLDTDRRNTIWQIGENRLCRRHYRYYNLKLLNFTVPPA